MHTGKTGKIVIIGASIAGLSAAIQLHKLGCNISVIEGSSGQLKEGNGTGVMLPLQMIQECMAHNLLDADIPMFPATCRSFHVKDHVMQGETESTKIWSQHLQAMTLNWNHIYENLRKLVNPEIYISHTKVNHIKNTGNGYEIYATDGRCFKADYIIAADGSNSLTRNFIVPDAIPQYAGYVVWRGVTKLLEDEKKQFDQHVPFYMFSQGHMVLYQIPDIHYKKTGETLVNWVIYQTMSLPLLNELLIDKKGVKHAASVPAGLLTNKHFDCLGALIEESLPGDIVHLIRRTKEPFLQVIQDFLLPNYTNNRIAFIGDAALILRPHTASGVLKALKNAIDLGNLIKNHPQLGFNVLFEVWKKQQAEIGFEEFNKSISMGKIITDPPDWKKMNHETTEKWWNTSMGVKGWYVVKPSEHSLFKKAGVEKKLLEECENFSLPAKL